MRKLLISLSLFSFALQARANAAARQKIAKFFTGWYYLWETRQTRARTGGGKSE